MSGEASYQDVVQPVAVQVIPKIDLSCMYTDAFALKQQQNAAQPTTFSGELGKPCNEHVVYKSSTDSTQQGISSRMAPQQPLWQIIALACQHIPGTLGRFAQL